MDRFVGEPYNLRAGDMVEVKVAAANVRGTGLASEPIVDGASVTWVPTAMGSLTLVQ
jgi:hypothetical protein